MISKMNKAETLESAQTYPMIKMYEKGNFAVMFISQRTGVVIWHDENNSAWKTGFYSNNWKEETFLYTDNIFTLSN